MQFSDITNLQGIIQDIDDRCSTDANKYLIADKVRNINNAYDRVIAFIQLNSKNIKWADVNLSAPYNFTDYNLIDGEKKVTITEPNKLQRIEIKDETGNWFKIKLMSVDEIGKSVEDFLIGGGIPKYVTIDGDNIQLFPTPNYTQIDSLRIYDQPEVTLFTATDTTATATLPRFASTLLSIEASIRYCSKHSKERLDTLYLDRKETYDLLKSWLKYRDNKKSTIKIIKTSPE